MKQARTDRSTVAHPVLARAKNGCYASPGRHRDVTYGVSPEWSPGQVDRSSMLRFGCCLARPGLGRSRCCPSRRRCEASRFESAGARRHGLFYRRGLFVAGPAGGFLGSGPSLNQLICQDFTEILRSAGGGDGAQLADALEWSQAED
jgi:hypothetical protein